MTQYDWGIRLNNGCLKVPEKMNASELEWEYYVAKLHWNYAKATAEDLEKIKEIANRIS